jgi:hypothetical protein
VFIASLIILMWVGLSSAQTMAEYGLSVGHSSVSSAIASKLDLPISRAQADSANGSGRSRTVEIQREQDQRMSAGEDEKNARADRSAEWEEVR